MIVSETHIINYIKDWIFGIKQCQNKSGFIVPITGGIDSFVCAALCLYIRPPCPVHLVFMGCKKDNEDIFVDWVNKNNLTCIIVKPDHPNINIEGDVHLGLLNAYITIIAKDKNLLKVGKFNKSEFTYLLNDIIDFYDCYPLIDLYRSEVLSLYKYLGLPDIDFSSNVENDTGITYDELEWLKRDDEETQIITSNSVPSVSKFWGSYSIRQKQIISNIYSL